MPLPTPAGVAFGQISVWGCGSAPGDPRMQAPAAATAKNLSHLLPSELIDKCIGSQIWVRGAAPPRPRPRPEPRPLGGRAGVAAG